MRAIASSSTISTISTTAANGAENHLLAALPPAELLRMKADMDWVALARGRVLHEAGVVIRQVYVPVTATVSLVSSMQDGDSAEVAVVGRDGVVGVCAFMGGGTVPSSAVVQSTGHAWRMAAATIEAHAARSDAAMRQLLRYTQALFGQMAQTSACHRHHLLDQQLCAGCCCNWTVWTASTCGPRTKALPACWGCAAKASPRPPTRCSAPG